MPLLTCANVEAPPGTGPDFAPPSVVERYPAPGSIVPDLDGDAWVRFDEPLQGPRNLERGLDLSPAWDWKFNPRVSGFSVQPREGWRPGVVYRIRVAPGVSDLVRNRTIESIEWTFSTGPEITDTRIDGVIYDRVTVTGVRDARILFLPADSTPYSVVSDTGGVYGMRSLPPGDYSVLAFQDQNRNRRLDPTTEPWDSAHVELPDPESRFALDLWMVPPDSTPPVLRSVVAFDTTTLVLGFDEPLDPEASLDSTVISVRRVDGTGTIGTLESVVGEASALVPDSVAKSDSTQIADDEKLEEDETPGERAEPDETDAVADSVAPVEEPAESDSAAMRQLEQLAEQGLPDDSVGAAGPDTLAADPGDEPGPTDRLLSAELRPRPFPTLVVRLERAMSEDTFRISVSGVPNLRGLRGGGDTTFVYVAPLPRQAPPELADSAAAADTSAVGAVDSTEAADTKGIPRQTPPSGPDNSGDSAAVQRPEGPGVPPRPDPRRR
jgi:hypothetical protein